MNNKNNNKNNKFFNRKRRNKRKFKRNKHHKIYSYKIRTAIVSYVTPDYTEQNLKFDIYQLLRNTDVFQTIQHQYLQYRLQKVTFAAIPRVVEGTDPSPIWIYLDTNADNNFNYSAMPELQGSKSLPVKHFSLTSYSSTGRQNDFHYWYDVQISAGDLAIRLHSEATPSAKTFWQFQIEFNVDFRGFIVQTSNTKTLVKEITTIKRSELQPLGEVDHQEGEEEDQKEEQSLDWNDISSDEQEN
jgi:hypothetical protein